MDKLLNPGRNMFAAGIIGLAIICFISKDFIVGRPPAWPASFHLNPALAYISGALLIISAVCIIIKFRAAAFADVISLLILVLSITREVPNYLNDWPNTYKTLALLGSTMIIAATFIKNDSSKEQKARDKLSGRLIFAGSALIASFFFASGYAHFKFSDFVINFIPAYIPFHTFWTYFAAICLFAGGLGLLIPRVRKIAALMSGIMVLGWFLLLHIPLFVANSADPSNQMGLCESFAFAGIFFALAGHLSQTNRTKSL